MNPDATLTPPCAKARQDASSSIRVAVVCDLVEERWPSMDLVGDMLFENLERHCRPDVAATQVRPSFQRRGSTLLAGKLARNAGRWMGRFVYYPRWLRGQRDRYDLFHIVDHSYSQLIRDLPRGRAVVTCHDLDTFRCLLDPAAEKRPAWFRAMARQILDGFRQAAHIIAVSAATRDELLRYRLAPPERISVIHNGVHPSCSPLPDPEADRQAGEMTGAGHAPVLLSVGSTLARKRLDVFLRVSAAVRSEVPGIRIVRVGGLTPELRRLAADLDLERSILCLPFLERRVLAAVYRSSTLLLHTAEAEGFGLPRIKAMACGCPVVASDIPVLREVGGAGASYCPVGDVAAWKGAVSRLLDEATGQGWQARRQVALLRAAKFSWAENARRTAGVYQEVAAMSRRR
jgi:glycosyltransferase involved in cell wall biosynthesis